MITLKTVLRANAMSCIIFGFIFVLAPMAVAQFVGGNNSVPELALTVLGIILLVNGAHLVWASFKELPHKFLIMYFSIGDFLWAIMTVILVAFGLWITTLEGVIASLLIAVVVASLGVLQLFKRKKMGSC